MIDKIEKKCMGCSACQNICPKQAIRLSYNEHYFYEPIVDYEKCVHCGKCVKICPDREFKFLNLSNPKSYAAYSSDEERLRSSSGAIFPILADYVLSNQGYVCGVAWDERWNAHHIIINSKEELAKLRFSKYVQSNPEESFTKTKELLEQKKLVLFTGTPCQVAGLTNFLGKQYDNLITIDLLCHGVPSPKIWQDYIEENFIKSEITDVCFRNKAKGWVACENCFYDIDCSYIETSDTKKPIGLFYEGFIKHKLSNESCLQCKFRKMPRPADFTIGDFWNYRKYNKSLNDNKGLSIVLCNNKKAEKILSKLELHFKFIKRIDLHKKWYDIEIFNYSRGNPERNLLFKNYEKYGATKSLELALGKHYDIALLSQFNGMNYGSGLVAYAQNKILESFGYTVLNVHKTFDCPYPYTEDINKSWKFARQRYYISRHFDVEESCRELNQLVDTFIVGSDTQWWWADVKKTRFCYWLDFVEANKKKLSFSTSFAQDETDIPVEKKSQVSFLYKRFDAISVREDTGKNILKQEFNIDSAWMIDPTFILEREEWDKLADSSKLEKSNYLAVYLLDFNEKKEKLIKEIAKKLNLEIIFIPHMLLTPKTDLLSEKSVDLEDFLYLIKHASFVITDSFHGTCFSIIFEKKFISLVNYRRGKARYKIFNDMGFEKRLCPNVEEIPEEIVFAEENFELSRQIIKSAREVALQWLEKVLKEPLRKTREVDYVYDFLKKELEELESRQGLDPRLTKLINKIFRILVRIWRKNKYIAMFGIFFSFIILLLLVLMIIVK